jgi:hypothetical protein
MSVAALLESVLFKLNFVVRHGIYIEEDFFFGILEGIREMNQPSIKKTAMDKRAGG